MPVVEPSELKVAVAAVETSVEAGAASVVAATQVVMPPVRRAEEPPSEACPGPLRGPKCPQWAVFLGIVGHP